MSPEYQDKIKKWNKLDTALYDHFNALLDEKVKAFGKEKMQAEIEKLNGRIFWRVPVLISMLEKVDQLNTKCIERYSQFDAKPWISRIVLKPKAGAICEKMSMGEVLFSDTLRWGHFFRFMFTFLILFGRSFHKLRGSSLSSPLQETTGLFDMLRLGRIVWFSKIED